MATAIHSKKSESKYVTCFADSRPDVDMTFRDVLLSRPTDHYLVGIDNFSMTNTSLSMIEPMTGDLSKLAGVLQTISMLCLSRPSSTGVVVPRRMVCMWRETGSSQSMGTHLRSTPTS